MGRYTGPFSIPQLQNLIGHFRTAPLGLVPKPNSSKFRIIQDLSFPRNDPLINSVNSEISSDDFPCDWGTFAQCYFLVASAPVGTQVSVFDVDSAYRNIPLHCDDQPHFCVLWNDQVFVDHCVAFGSSSSAGLFGRVADAFVAIVKKFGAEQVLKWVDDIIFFRYPIPGIIPYQYSYDSNLIFETANSLGWPWQLPKHSPFSSQFTYLGFAWDVSLKTVQLPLNKKQKFLSRCALWNSHSKKTLRDAQQLFGSLNHCCLAIRYAKSHLNGLRVFLATFPPNSSPFLSRFPSQQALDDIAWWTNTLSQPFVGSKIALPGRPLPVSIFVDASTSWGIGVLVNNKWAAWRFSSDAIAQDRTIGWAEMIAVELSISLLCTNFPKHSHFLIRSDNQGVVGAISSGSSRSTSQNASLSRLCSTLLFHESFLSTEYVQSKQNPADPISRGILPNRSLRIRTRIPIDEALIPYITRV